MCPGTSTFSQNKNKVTAKPLSNSPTGDTRWKKAAKKKGMGLSAATEHTRESAQQYQGLVLGLGLSTGVDLHWRTPD